MNVLSITLDGFRPYHVPLNIGMPKIKNKLQKMKQKTKLWEVSKFVMSQGLITASLASNYRDIKILIKTILLLIIFYTFFIDDSKNERHELQMEMVR